MNFASSTVATAGLALLLASPAAAAGWTPTFELGAAVTSDLPLQASLTQATFGSPPANPDIGYVDDGSLWWKGVAVEQHWQPAMGSNAKVIDVAGISDFWRDLDKITALPPKRIVPKGPTFPEITITKKIDQLSSMNSADFGWMTGGLIHETQYQYGTELVY